MKIVLAIWAASRLVILGAFLFAAPHATVAAFANWDGGWYASIVQHGYEFARDGRQHNIAFFPMFPVVSAALVHIGLPWPVAGLVVNNVGFLLAILLLYTYARERLGERSALWVAVIACVTPLSLFASVAYSEGLFMFFSTAALLSYNHRRYALAGLAAAAAAATRPLGIALSLGMLIAAIVERRSMRDILSCSLGIVGALAFPVFCLVRFGDVFAFVHAQTGWRHAAGFDFGGWLGILRGARLGRIHDWISIAFVAMSLPCVVVFRRFLGKSDLYYVAICGIIIAFSGTPFSVDRLLYSVVPILMATSELFRRLPLIGYAIAIVSLIILGMDAISFARFTWVA